MSTGPVTAAFFGGFNPPGPGYDLERARDLLREVFRDSSTFLPGCMCGDEGKSIRLTNGFSLTSCYEPTLAENEICTRTFEGVFRVEEVHGYMPLLLLLKIQLSIWEACGFRSIQMADGQGNQIMFDGFDDLKQIVADHGYDFKEVRRHAVALGLTAEVVDLSQIASDIDDQYY